MLLCVTMGASQEGQRLQTVLMMTTPRVPCRCQSSTGRWMGFRAATEPKAVRWRLGVLACWLEVGNTVPDVCISVETLSASLSSDIRKMHRGYR